MKDGFGETVGRRWPLAQRFSLSAEGAQREATKERLTGADLQAVLRNVSPR